MKHVRYLDIAHGNIGVPFQTNIFVDADGRARVAGPGAASIPSAVLSVGVNRFFPSATPELINPERFRSTNTGATTTCDIYVFDILIWEVSGVRMISSG